MLFGEQGRAIKLLIRRRHIQRRVLVEEIGRLKRHLDDLAWHNGKILDASGMLEAELHEQDEVRVLNIVPSIRPRPHPRTAPRLIGVFAARVELAVFVLSNVDVVICEFRSFVMEAVRVCDHFLKWRGVDFVADRLAIDWVADGGILNFESSICVVISVQPAGVTHDGLLYRITYPGWVEVRTRHGMRLLVDQSVVVAINGGVHSKREYVLVMRSQNARVHDGTPRYFDPLIDRLRTNDTSGSYLVIDLARLVEDKSHDVLVVGNGDD